MYEDGLKVEPDNQSLKDSLADVKARIEPAIGEERELLEGIFLGYFLAT